MITTDQLDNEIGKILSRSAVLPIRHHQPQPVILDPCGDGSMLLENRGSLPLPVGVKHRRIQMASPHVMQRLASMEIHLSRRSHASRPAGEYRAFLALAAPVGRLPSVDE